MQNFKVLRLIEDLSLWHIWNTRSNIPESIINPIIWFECKLIHYIFKEKLSVWLCLCLLDTKFLRRMLNKYCPDIPVDYSVLEIRYLMIPNLHSRFHFVESESQWHSPLELLLLIFYSILKLSK